MLLCNRLRWVGHVKRMVDARLPKQLLYGQIKTGYRRRGRPKLRYSDTVQVSLKATNISLGTWETLAMKRGAWRAAIFNGVRRFEEQRTGLLEQQRAARKRATPCPGNPPAGLVCPTCNKQCLSRIGLFSHQRSHTDSQAKRRRVS